MLTPKEIVRYAKVKNDLLTEHDKKLLRLEYMNAALQRAQKLPDLKDLLGEKRSPSLNEIAQALNAKPKFEKKEHVKAD